MTELEEHVRSGVALIIEKRYKRIDHRLFEELVKFILTLMKNPR